MAKNTTKNKRGRKTLFQLPQLILSRLIAEIKTIIQIDLKKTLVR